MVPPRALSFARSLRSRRLLTANGYLPRPRMSVAATNNPATQVNRALDDSSIDDAVR
jgi:hypothetical protein